MPELPEVETMCRGIQPVVGSRIERVHRPKSPLRAMTMFPRIDAWQRRTHGKLITAVSRLGKRVLVHLDTEDIIVFEPRMTGLALLVDPPDEKHLRLVVELSGGQVPKLQFWSQRGLSVLRLLTPAQFTDLHGPHKLGPDALEVSIELLKDRFYKSRRAIKVALLDQKALAGIGNLYASEILHRAGVHPERACCDVRPAQWKRIHASMIEVLEEAIEHQGSTLSDGTYRNANNEAGNFQNSHRVYQRRGETCRQCNEAIIERIVQAQRSTFFCPKCQRPKIR